MEAKPHFPLGMLLMDGVWHCSNTICSPSLSGTSEVYYIYLNKTRGFGSSGTDEAWFSMGVSCVDSLAELVSHPGSGMENGRAMAESAHLRISSFIKLVRAEFLRDASSSIKSDCRPADLESYCAVSMEQQAPSGKPSFHGK